MSNPPGGVRTSGVSLGPLVGDETCTTVAVWGTSARATGDANRPNDARVVPHITTTLPVILGRFGAKSRASFEILGRSGMTNLRPSLRILICGEEHKRCRDSGAATARYSETPRIWEVA
jgi:hypothetical protein